MTKLTPQELERIYELTFKYGWLEAEERQEGWLPDAAYKEKARIEGELGPLLNSALEKMGAIYEHWLKEHSKEGWKAAMDKEYFQSEDGLNWLLLHFESLNQFNNIVYILSNVIERAHPELGDEVFEEALSYNENDVSNIFAMMDTYRDDILAEKDKILDKLYDVWARRFSVTKVYPVVENAYWDVVYSQGEPLSERIVGLQIGLNTAHSTGTMADHVVDGATYPGSGKEILDDLASGPHVEDWTNDLTSVLGYEPGIGQIYEDKPTYYEPELGKHLGKAAEMLSDKRKLAIFAKFWGTLVRDQVDLKPEFAKIIDDNLWELC